VLLVVLATENLAKLAELRRILAGSAVIAGRVELVGLAAFPDYPDVAETGRTFEDNALLKARACAGRTGLAAVADDSGLAVEALNGMPGVLSARWAGRHGDDAANLALVLAQLGDVGEPWRGASFVCAAALVAPDGTETVVRGEVHGRLLREPRGTGGFGYDPVFVPDGATLTTAQMAPADKDAVSHRGRALRALLPAIERLAVRTP
jgi:XTP/dITP diphosphohydrolase